MRNIGMTGGIGSGKNQVAEMFEKLGFYTIDSDISSRKVMAKGGTAYEKIVSFFGSDILDEKGDILRKKLGDIVFNDKEKLKILENIGDYGLLDKYKIYVSNGSGEITNEFEITFEQMKELLEGKEVNINGKRISAQDISNDEDNIKLGESSNVTIDNGIKAIKYNYKNETDRTKYMFILNGYIYYINVPNAPRYETNVNLFLDSLTKK